MPLVESCGRNRIKKNNQKKRGVGLRRQLEKQLDFSQSTAIVISPVWTPWLDELPFKHVFYDCIDDVSRPHSRAPELDNALYEQLGG